MLVLTPHERIAIETIRGERPEMLAIFSRWITGLLDDLGWASQGLVATEADADELLLKLRDQAVASLLADMETWGEDDDVRKGVVDLFARHLLAEARAAFVRRVVEATRN